MPNLAWHALNKARRRAASPHRKPPPHATIQTGLAARWRVPTLLNIPFRRKKPLPDVRKFSSLEKRQTPKFLRGWARDMAKQVCRNPSAELCLAVWAIAPVVFRNRGYRRGGSFTR